MGRGMNLNRSQLPSISRQIVAALVAEEAVEVADRREVERDVESVLSNYLDEVDRVLGRARDIVQQRGLPQGQFGRAKEMAAKKAGIGLGDDGLDHVLGQMLHVLMQSQHVEEVFAEDHQLKRIIRKFLRATDEADAALEREVRSKLKHVEEGSRVWEIEYARMKEEIKRRRGIE